MLQQQFNQIAAATAASMPGAAPDAGNAPKGKAGGSQAAAAPTAKAAAKPAAKSPAKKAARKPAASKAATKNTGPADGKP